MSPQASEWIHLILRWFHIAAAIFWVGATYGLVKLARLVVQGTPNPEPASSAWFVQGGDVFVAGRRDNQSLVPGKRHVLFWESISTWVSGFLLLGFLYYHGGFLLEDDARISVGVGAAIGVAVMLVGWAVYDLIWISPLRRFPLVAGGLCYILLVALSRQLALLFSGRAAFIHIGALLGTILTANLLMRVLPAQRKILAAAGQGQPPDAKLLERARIRSRHNLLLVIPVIFLMISNHFPLIYGRGNNWLILSLLVLAGSLAAKVLFGI